MKDYVIINLEEEGKESKGKIIEQPIKFNNKKFRKLLSYLLNEIKKSAINRASQKDVNKKLDCNKIERVLNLR